MHGPHIYLEMARAVGADDCLAKPFAMDELVKKVANLMATTAEKTATPDAA